jgi:hypothetical protein
MFAGAYRLAERLKRGCPGPGTALNSCGDTQSTAKLAEKLDAPSDADEREKCSSQVFLRLLIFIQLQRLPKGKNPPTGFLIALAGNYLKGCKQIA